MENKITITWLVKRFVLVFLFVIATFTITRALPGLAQNGDDENPNASDEMEEKEVYLTSDPDSDDAQITEEFFQAAYGSPLVISAAAFRNDGSDPDGYFFDFSGGYINGNGTACLMAPAYLPNGVTVTSMHASLYDNATGNIAVYLRRVDVSDGTSDVLATVSTATDSTAIQTRSDTSINYADISYPLYAYYLTTCLNYSDHRLDSVRIYYMEP